MLEQVDLAHRMTALQEEVAQLKQALVSHAIVDQAIGVVIALGGLRPEPAWDVLKEVSQHTNTKLREVAEHIVQWPHCEWLPPEIREALDTALKARASQRTGMPEGTGA
ncbi:ANTAR domain-containing protein [Streptomyces sp. NPDC001595]|uniref:ANTAR domain-containing protein n=1 Tax=Streptomyces sp. NPDC001532 TaxID=3154520 RepID=UPI00332002B1